MILALASMIMAAANPAPNWQLHASPGGQAWVDTNSMLDNGVHRSILFRTDPAQHEVHFVSRIEMDCRARSIRVRNFAVYDLNWRELVSHRVAAGQFFHPGEGGWLIDAVCSSPSVPRDPVPADAPGSYTVATDLLCEQSRRERAHDLPDWLDQILRASQFDEDAIGRVAQSCASYERAHPVRG